MDVLHKWLEAQLVLIEQVGEANYLAQKLVRQGIGTNNIDSCNRT